MDVGILKLAFYTPRGYVEQRDLETRHGCPGKYTVGLLQRRMAVWDPAREDVVSMALTACRDLLLGEDARRIGYVGVV